MTSTAHGIFLRLECYAHAAAGKKSSPHTVRMVLNEAMRTKGFCPHVTSPMDPKILFGVSPLQLLQLAMMRPVKNVQYFHKMSGTFKFRRMRADHPVMVAGVISVPDTWKSEGQRWNIFKAVAIQWLIKTFGADKLVSIVEHQDERCPHLHFIMLPGIDQDIADIHPGRRAVQQLPPNSGVTRKNEAYKAAMRTMLDSFHIDVGRDFDLLRSHVRARRMTRRQWQVWNHYRNQRPEMQTVSAEVAALDKVTMDTATNEKLESRNANVPTLALLPPTADVARSVESRGFLVRRDVDRIAKTQTLDLLDLTDDPFLCAPQCRPT